MSNVRPLAGPEVSFELAVLSIETSQRAGSDRLEAITSRPLLLAAVGKAASHANQTTLYLTPMHGRADILKRLIANIGKALQHVKAAAEKFKDLDRWGCLLRYISDRIAPVTGPPKPPQGLPEPG